MFHLHARHELEYYIKNSIQVPMIKNKLQFELWCITVPPWVSQLHFGKKKIS